MSFNRTGRQLLRFKNMKTSRTNRYSYNPSGRRKTVKYDPTPCAWVKGRHIAIRTRGNSSCYVTRMSANISRTSRAPLSAVTAVQYYYYYYCGDTTTRRKRTPRREDARPNFELEVTRKRGGGGQQLLLLSSYKKIAR